MKILISNLLVNSGCLSIMHLEITQLWIKVKILTKQGNLLKHLKNNKKIFYSIILMVVLDQ
jgi:hypothetical protein